MLIRISQRGAQEAASTLNRDVRGQVTRAIRSTLRSMKQQGKSLTKARYTTDVNKLGKITSRASGLSGRLTISGRRNLIKHFKLSPNTRPPHNPPGGLHVQIVRGQGGQLPHAFVSRAGIVFERNGHKLKHLSTVSIVSGWKVYAAQIEQVGTQELERNLEGLL